MPDSHRRAVPLRPRPEAKSGAADVAVIGAGVSGLAAARRLEEAGADVTVFEKSRGLGGRCATRRRGELSFDHGARYFTVRDPDFARAIAPHLDEGRVVRWAPRVVRLGADGPEPEPEPRSERYVAVPGMSALGTALAGGTRVLRHTHVSAIRRGRSGEWTVTSDAGGRFGPFQAVLLSCPAPQAAALLDSAFSFRAPEDSPPDAERRDAPPDAARPDVPLDLLLACRDARLLPCWTAMVALRRKLPLEFDAAFVEDEMLDWAARESSRPGRKEDPDRWVLQAKPGWSSERLEERGDRVADALLERFFRLAAIPPAEPAAVFAHRWRFARSARAPGGGAGAGPLVDPATRVGLCGDWTRGDRIEDAYLSGREAAGGLAAAL